MSDNPKKIALKIMMDYALWTEKYQVVIEDEEKIAEFMNNFSGKLNDNVTINTVTSTFINKTYTNGKEEITKE